MHLDYQHRSINHAIQAAHNSTAERLRDFYKEYKIGKNNLESV